MTSAQIIELDKTRNIWLSKGYKRTNGYDLTRRDRVIKNDGKIWIATDTETNLPTIKNKELIRVLRASL